MHPHLFVSDDPPPDRCSPTLGDFGGAIGAVLLFDDSRRHSGSQGLRQPPWPVSRWLAASGPQVPGS